MLERHNCVIPEKNGSARLIRRTESSESTSGGRSRLKNRVATYERGLYRDHFRFLLTPLEAMNRRRTDFASEHFSSEDFSLEDFSLEAESVAAITDTDKDGPNG